MTDAERRAAAVAEEEQPVPLVVVVLEEQQEEEELAETRGLGEGGAVRAHTPRARGAPAPPC